ncbi:LEAF RUST 10 DISEASE-RESISTANCEUS RECEPTOR-LIKE PROTEIN KINASE-like 2.1 [Henckelia pumila]|uniref:LEAF RUST 10 DISEASE-RESISTANCEUS RECEPTOR-LIKE PROTEIN KINASE-like 2.1 n=1 Tax=Henckelia pumila TaxID=405737 RepID=UPI003C6DC914
MFSSTIVLLQTFTWFLAVALVNGATFTVVNNCTNTIWPAISGSPSLDSIGFDLPSGSTGVFKAPKGWVGRLWGRTGCTFDATGQGSCRTGDCGSGRIDCNGFDSTGITLAEFSIHRSVDSMDSYKISLANGFNLPIMIEARGGSRQHCQSTGCTENVNRLCPAGLRTKSGQACQNPCKATGTDRTSECGPANYTACPMALIIPDDDANATFTCSAGDYVITFCPSLFSLQNEKCREPFNCGVLSNIVYPFWGGDHPEICGFPGFELTNCGGEFPQLNIDSKTYRVLGFHFWEQTLRVERQDLKESLCPSVLYNTTFNPNLFSFPQNYSYENATLYYDCIEDHSDYKMPYNDNRFTCPINRTQTLNYFVAGKVSELGYNVKCKTSISIPVNQSATKTLYNVSTPLNDLKNAFHQGFYIQWINSIASCQGCVRSGGVCVYDPNSTLINCNIFQHTLVEAPTIGLPIALGPTPFFYSDTGYGESGLSAMEKFLIGTALVATFIVAAAFILLCLVRRRRRHKRSRSALYQDTNPNVENFLLNNAYLAPQRYEYSHIKKITKSFSDKLGQGGYGSVYKGTLSNGKLVAVKLLIESKSNGEDFINEVASISRTSHVNIVNLLGFCYEKNRRALIYEFMPNKSLDEFINTNGPINTNCQLDWEILHKIALGVARGLEYLHKGCNTRIVHFDIKPQNILLDEEFCPKISDFGLAKLCEKRQSILSMVGTRGTVGYISPEVFSRNFGGVSHKSDVYSYGMMVLEMAGAKGIVGMGSIQSSGHYFPDKIYDQVTHQENKNFDDIVSSEEDDDLSRKMFLVGFWCIQTIPADRPSMSKVVDMLEGSLQSIQIPPKPYLFNPPNLGQGFSSSASGNMEMGNKAED